MSAALADPEPELGQPNPAPRWRKVTVILNSQSGTIAGLGPEKVSERLKSLLQEAGLEADVHCVPGNEINATLESARAGDSDAVIIGGGDGTVAAAAGIFSGSDKPLGILPLGTFNLAARDVGMPLDWEAAAAALLTAPVAETDLLDVGGKPALCVLVLGFYPALQMGQPEYHGNWLVKAWRTAKMAVRSAAVFPPLSLTVSGNGTHSQYRSRIALLANNDYEDLFGLIPRRKTLSAGYFTLYISTHRTRLGMLKSFLAWTVGRWKQDRELKVVQATEIEIRVPRRKRLPVMRDGELEKTPMPLRVTLLPKALLVLAPRLAEEKAGTLALESRL
ncbi:MAG: hypothetical protein JWM59_4916 [Verrucomicrobiales bacterium]|nr:hypothetical protein [Verrucomicrobiales bacterium]